MTRTPARERELRAIAETEEQHELARSVGCDSCGAKIGRPCQSRHGTKLRAEHPGRISRAERMRAAGEVECSFCARLELTEAQREITPWPVDEDLVMCEVHQKLIDIFNEAKER